MEDNQSARASTLAFTFGDGLKMLVRAAAAAR
jgi:hypothetical protein